MNAVTTNQGTDVEPAPQAAPSRALRVGAAVKKFCLDMLPVLAGVIIGLFVDNQREEQQHRHLLEATLQSLLDEFTQNGQEIRELLPRHVRLIDTLGYYQQQEQYTLQEVLKKAGGLSASDIYTTNWQATLNNNSLQLLNLQTVKLLSKIENRHKELNTQIEVMYPILFGLPMYQRGQAGVAYRQSILGLLINHKADEETLLQLYADFEKIVRTGQYQRK